MITDYLINNRLYLKEKIRIQCAKLIITDDKTGHWNPIHEWVELEDFIDLIPITTKSDVPAAIRISGIDSFVYKKDDKVFIYWCDVNIFTELHCLTIKEVRNNKLNEILD